jgi:hypothetical protein
MFDGKIKSLRPTGINSFYIILKKKKKKVRETVKSVKHTEKEVKSKF